MEILKLEAVAVELEKLSRTKPNTHRGVDLRKGKYVLLALGKALFSHLSSFLNPKLCLGVSHLMQLAGFSLKRKNPAHFKNSYLTLSPRRGISRSSEDSLAQARILQLRQVQIVTFLAQASQLSPRRDYSRSSELTLAHARIHQYSPGFHPPR
ncbi:hypothetical protein Lal_00042180 [Lupinus albus]|nr:hypothetical protein Lal_00042180 [Lupinus albus]